MKCFRVPEETKIYVRKQGDLAISLAGTLKNKNMTVKELSQKTGISVYRLKEILAGNVNLTLKTIAKIENAVGENLSLNIQFVKELKEILLSAYGIASVEFWQEIYEKINNFLKEN
jgi:transcriptional regulator with XRE-family HTH domain